MDFSSFEAFVDSTLLFLDGWGFIIVIIFAIMHPIFENPLSLFNLSLGIALMGTVLGYTVVFLSNVVGIMILYYLATTANEKTGFILRKKKVSKKVLEWIEETHIWKHIFVIGVPMIPTYPVKLAVPLSGVSFKKYMITLVGAYLFLFFGNTLIYYGVVSFITDNIPNWVSFMLLLVLVIYVYFGKYMFKKEGLKESESV